MHKKHYDDTRPAFPIVFPGSDISPRDAIGVPSPARQISMPRTGAESADTRPPPRLPAGSASNYHQILPPMEDKMFATEHCSKVGCFLEAAMPGIAPAVALICMLSIAAFASWVM